MSFKEKIIQTIEDKKQSFICVSDAIWEYAEAKFDVPKSANEHINLLKNENFKVQVGIENIQHAFKATYGNGKYKIGFLCEYDALPGMNQMQDSLQKQANPNQQNGHGCGHNLLGSASVAAAVGLKEYVDQNKDAQIIIYGTPAEEFGYAKSLLARDGVFDAMDALITWHPMERTMIWDMSSLAVYQAFFHFTGISSHAGANPELGRSALDAAELMNVGVQFLREHIIDGARIHYAFTDVGGSAANVVQPSASLNYVVRAPNISQVDEIFKRVCNIAKGAALMTDTQVSMQMDASCADYIVNKTLCEVMYEALNEVYPIKFDEQELDYIKKYSNTVPEQNKKAFANTIKALNPALNAAEIEAISKKALDDSIYPLQYPAKPLTASTDVGDASWKAPTVQLMLACYPQGLPPHSWQWVAMGKSSVAHKNMLVSAKVMALCAYKLFENPTLLTKAKQEHEQNLNGKTYINPIPKDDVIR